MLFRSQDDIDNYRYGYSDVGEKMLYAMFNLLGEYLREEPYDLRSDYSEDEIQSDEGLKAQQHDLDEAREIYRWWTVERKKDYKAYNDLLDSWVKVRKTDKQQADTIFDQTQDQEKYLDDKTEEMTIRLMKIRRSLWS